MALPSNVQCSLDGSPFPFFSPYPTPGSFRINVFAQLSPNHGRLFSNPYIFPPIILIPQVLRFAKTQSIPCTLAVPDVRPRKLWWPLFQSFSSFLLAPQGYSLFSLHRPYNIVTQFLVFPCNDRTKKNRIVYSAK